MSEDKNDCPCCKRVAELFSEPNRRPQVEAQPAAVTGADFVEHTHPEYGPGYFATADVIAKLSGQPPAVAGEAELKLPAWWSCTRSCSCGPGECDEREALLDKMRSHIAPAAPLVGEPPDKALVWAVACLPTGAKNSVTLGAERKPVIGVDAAEAAIELIRAASPAAPAGVPTDELVYAEMRRRDATWNRYGVDRGYAVKLAISSFRALLAANSFHSATCDSSEASGSAIPARPTIPGDELLLQSMRFAAEVWEDNLSKDDRKGAAFNLKHDIKEFLGSPE